MADALTTNLPDPGADAAAEPRPVALSPSRASDFKSCPLLYRFRAIDRLPEPPSPEAVRGTLVHAVLEQMFGSEPAERTAERTKAAVRPLWSQLSEAEPGWTDLVPEAGLDGWLSSAEALVDTYFGLEDPTRFTPEACELRIEVDVADGVPLRGFVDRLDVAPTGEVRVVDYKTGRSPSEIFEAGALYQLKFYALMIFRLRGAVPAQLKLLYLGDNRELVYRPDEAELVAFERSVGALWKAVLRSRETGDFRPRTSRLCDWCSFKAYCPEYDGTPPPYPGTGTDQSAGGGLSTTADTSTTRSGLSAGRDETLTSAP